MLKLNIVLDEEKILREDKYDLDAMWDLIDDAFTRHGLIKLDKGLYRDAGTPQDMAYFWRNIWDLTKLEWFMMNVSEFVWYNSDCGDNENDFVTEDILKYCRENPRDWRF